MNEILDINYKIFSEILPIIWRDIFNIEFKEY
jgi:hypothetical protein